MKDKIKEAIFISILVIIALVFLIFFVPVGAHDWKILKDFWNL